MKITYLGHSCFCIESNNGIRLLTDPYTRVGYELPKGLTADIILVSHGHFDHAHVDAIEGNPTVISTAGIFALNGIIIKGINTWHDPKQGALRGKNVIFQFTVDGVTFCHFGDLGEDYRPEIAQEIDGADVWLIPVGGTYTIDAAQAKEYIDKATPKVVIPMHYRPDDGALDIAKIDDFLSKVEENRVFACPDGEIVCSPEDLHKLSGKIVYMERCK